ncbi:MAG TPA: murein biosynthesis integral membrane protein MurJ [Gammaproteobacteria bacterium]|nr:murein biosynthesis integral membrane protein MurJ [Gammaproteobacteria bacterium]
MNRTPSSKDAGQDGSGSAGLIRSTSAVGSMTLLSRISGLAREIVFARLFGAGPFMDAFFFAFKLPNLLRRFFAEGAFSQAFVPVIAEFRATRSAEEARELVARVSGTLALTLFVVSLAGVVAAPVLVLIFGTGFATGDGPVELATQMLRFTFPYIFFISLTAMAGAVLNTWGRFAVPAFTPVLLNLVLIAAAIWLAPRLGEPTLALAVGVFVAGLVQLLFQLPFLISAGLLPRPRLGFAHEGVRRILKLMLPIIFGSSVAQINILFDTWIATFLAAGSISWLYYSDRLVEFPLGVFGIAIATVILPTLSSHHARESRESFSATIDWALRSVLLIALPAAVALFLLAEPLLATLFFGGAFVAFDVEMAGASLMAFAPGLLGFILVKILVPGYFSRQDSKTPVKIAVKALVLGMVLNVVFVLTLIETGWAAPHVGLAAATTLSSLANAGMLLHGLLAESVYRPRAGWPGLFLRVGIATLVMTAFLVWLLGLTGDWIEMQTGTRILWLAISVIGGAGVYFIAGWIAGLRPAQFRIH